MNKAAFSFSIFALLVCVLPTSAFSQEPVTKVPSKESQPSKQASKLDWKNLSPLQQAVLASLESDWSSFNQSSKMKWLKVANRYPTMSAADQERLQGRMSEWSKLPQKDRRMARDNYLSSMQLPPEQKKGSLGVLSAAKRRRKTKISSARACPEKKRSRYLAHNTTASST